MVCPRGLHKPPETTCRMCVCVIPGVASIAFIRYIKGCVSQNRLKATALQCRTTWMPYSLRCVWKSAPRRTTWELAADHRRCCSQPPRRDGGVLHSGPCRYGAPSPPKRSEGKEVDDACRTPNTESRRQQAVSKSSPGSFPQFGWFLRNMALLLTYRTQYMYCSYRFSLSSTSDLSKLD